MLRRGAVAADAVVKMAQTFRSGTNDIDAIDYVDLFLDDEGQTNLDDLNDLYVLVNFRPVVTKKNWRMDCGVAGYDNTFGLPPFFPTRLRFEDYIYRLWVQQDGVVAAHVDAAQNHTKSNYMRNPPAAEIFNEEVANLLKRKIRSTVSRLDDLTIAFDYEGEVTAQHGGRRPRQDLFDRVFGRRGTQPGRPALGACDSLEAGRGSPADHLGLIALRNPQGREGRHRHLAHLPQVRCRRFTNRGLWMRQRLGQHSHPGLSNLCEHIQRAGIRRLPVEQGRPQGRDRRCRLGPELAQRASGDRLGELVVGVQYAFGKGRKNLQCRGHAQIDKQPSRYDSYPRVGIAQPRTKCCGKIEVMGRDGPVRPAEIHGQRRL
jgi:hypothetical protein